MAKIERDGTTLEYYITPDDNLAIPATFWIFRSDPLHAKYLEILQEAIGIYASIEKLRAKLLFYRDEWWPNMENKTYADVVAELRSLDDFADERLKYRDPETMPLDWDLQLWQYHTGLENEIKRRELPINGYVYIVRSVTGHCKIGCAKDPNDRLRTFGVKLPFEIELDLLIPTDDHRALEKKLHQLFDYERVGGEWFKLSESDIEMIYRVYGGKRSKRTL